MTARVKSVTDSGSDFIMALLCSSTTCIRSLRRSLSTLADIEVDLHTNQLTL